jgi:uncharacterized protein DUF1735
MKKRIYLITTILLSAVVLSLSSCLKDSRLVDFTKVGTLVEFPFGGTNNFSRDAITATPDSDAKGSIVVQFAVNIASPTVPTSATTVTVAIDNSIITAYNATETAVNYLPLSADQFSFPATSVTIPAGQRSAILSVTFYKNLIDPTQSYMLPIKIVSASDGATVSGNYGIHYFHLIGNDFAGAYLHDYTRTPAAGNYVGQPATLFPVTPLQFETTSGYYTGTVRYEVTFTKTGTGSSATYSNFGISLNSDDVSNILQPAGIAVTVQPVILGYDDTKQYTYAQATSGLFDFKYTVHSSADRVVEDKFYKP